MPGGGADVHLLVRCAVLGRHVVDAQLHRHDPASARVLAAGLGGQQAGILADAALDDVGWLGEILVLQALVHLLHDLFPQHDGRVRIGVRQHDLLGVVVAAPHDARIIGRVAGKPAVEVARRGAGLAGDRHAAQLGGGAGTVRDRVFQHVGDIPGRDVLHGDMRLLRVVENHFLARGVHDLRVGSGLAVDALVGKRRVGRRHRAHRHAVRQAAHRHRRQINVGIHRAVAADVFRDQRGQAHLLLGEVVAEIGRQLRRNLDGDGVERFRHGLADGDKAAIGGVGILGPVIGICKGIGRVVIDRRRRDDPCFEGRRVDGDRLDGGAGRQQALRGPVEGQAALLLPDAAGHGDHVAGFVVHDDDAGLELLGACRLGHVVEIFIDLVHSGLHVGVHRAVDGVAAGHDHFVDDVVVVARLVAQVVHHVADDLIDEIGIVFAVARVGLLAAGVLEYQLLRGGRIILRLGDLALLEHLRENELLPLLIVVGVDIGVVQGGVVRDADEGGALGQVEVLNVLAEIDLRRALHAVALFAEIDDVHIVFQDLCLGVRFFKFQRAEYFDQLPADGDLLLARDVFDELLGDGGAAGAAGPQEHLDAGLDRRVPVHALVLLEALVLDRDTGVDEVLRQLVVFDPDAVFVAVELLQHDLLAGLGVLAVDRRRLIQREALEGEGNLRGQVVFDIECEQAGENEQRQKQHQKYRTDRLAEYSPAMSGPAVFPRIGFRIGFGHRRVPPRHERSRFFSDSAPNRQSAYTIVIFYSYIITWLSILLETIFEQCASAPAGA